MNAAESADLFLLVLSCLFCIPCALGCAFKIAEIRDEGRRFDHAMKLQRIRNASRGEK